MDGADLAITATNAAARHLEQLRAEGVHLDEEQHGHLTGLLAAVAPAKADKAPPRKVTKD